MKAQYYTYRNLHTGGFSVRYKGKIIRKIHGALIVDAKFVVSQAGNKRAIVKGQRNVHAYIVSPNQPQEIEDFYYTFWNIKTLEEVWYNPFKVGSFMFNGTPIYAAKNVWLDNGKAFVDYSKQIVDY